MLLKTQGSTYEITLEEKRLSSAVKILTFVARRKKNLRRIVAGSGKNEEYVGDSLEITPGGMIVLRNANQTIVRLLLSESC